MARVRRWSSRGLLLLSIPVFILAGRALHRAVLKSERGVRAEGRVVALTPRPSTFGAGTLYWPEIEVVPPGRPAARVSLGMGYSSSPYRIGDAVPVVYDREDPARLFDLGEEQNWYFAALALGFLGGASVVFGLVLGRAPGGPPAAR